MQIKDPITHGTIDFLPSVTDDSVFVYKNEDRGTGFKIFLTHCFPLAVTIIRWNGIEGPAYTQYHSLGKDFFTPVGINEDLYMEISLNRNGKTEHFCFVSWDDSQMFAAFLIERNYYWRHLRA